MGPEVACVIIPLVVFVVILFWVMSKSMDQDRIHRYIQSRGGKVLSCNWAPFGKGWFGENTERIYEVKYLDRDGHEHQASCKTSMFTGVYWTEDFIIRYADQVEEFPMPGSTSLERESLEEENARLREELERLKRERQSD